MDKYFKKIKQISSLADEVYQQVYDAIRAGAIQPDQRIVQEKLADQLEVSRTPVREALLRLENDGVLARAGRSGFVIRAFSAAEVVQIYQAREAIEGFAAGLLSEAGDAAAVERLEALIRQTESGIDASSSAPAYFNANRAIHRAVVAAAGNPFLLDMFDSVWNLWPSFYLFSELSADDLARSLDGHLALCATIRRGDAPGAAAAMREHIRQGLALHRGAAATDANADTETKTALTN